MAVTGTRAGTQYTVTKPAPAPATPAPAPTAPAPAPQQAPPAVRPQPQNQGRGGVPVGGGGGGGGAGGGGGGGAGGGGGGGGGNQNPPAGNQPAQPRPLIVFSLTPGGANSGILDYSLKAGYYHYKGATEKLEEELYDCTPDGFYQFIQSLKT